MKYLPNACILLAVGTAAQVGIAAPLTWSLLPVDMHGCCIVPLNEQQGSLTGTFVFDPQTQIYSDWEFTISGFTPPVDPLNATFTPATSSIILSSAAFLHITYLGQQADLVMTFGFLTMGGVVQVPLTSLGGSVPVLISNSSRFESFFATGNGVASSVPEPLAGVLVLAGAAFLCFSKRGWFAKRA